MRQCKTILEWKSARALVKSQNKSIGFVPTMGALHEGHLELVRRSLRENDCTLVSIFVNPTQFDDPKDFEKYPQPLERDLNLLENEGVDFVLLPSAPELYVDGYRYRVIENELSKKFCGAHREGHFSGVLSVVLKLLNISGARRAYFGEKDWQQLELVKGMVEAFFLPVEIVACPTVREKTGLAMSSRNRRLKPEQKILAAAFYRELSSSKSAAEVKLSLEKLGFEVDYIEDTETRRLGAVRIEGVRLIDNVVLSSEQTPKEVSRGTHP